jgi:hypothetical protein
MAYLQISRRFYFPRCFWAAANARCTSLPSLPPTAPLVLQIVLQTTDCSTVSTFVSHLSWVLA